MNPSLPEPIQVPEGSVVITPAQVYNEVIHCTRSVEKLITENKQDRRDQDKLEDRVDRLDGRLSAVERRLWMITGAASAVGGILGSMAGRVAGIH